MAAHAKIMRGNSFAKGSKRSEKTKEILRQQKLGKKLTEEHKKKIGIRSKEKWDNFRKQNQPKSAAYKKYNVTQGQLASWSKQVRERDGHICTSCGDTKNLHAHHIKKKILYPDLALDLDNGTTLCRTCHIAAHKTRWITKHAKHTNN